MNLRPWADRDAPAVAALICAEEERFYGRPGRVTGADILMFLQQTKEAWVWEEDGRMAASSSYGIYGDAAHVRGFVANKGRGLGTEILERGEAFARAEGDAAAVSPVATVGAAEGHELLPAETHAAATAVSSLYFDACFINEFHGDP